MSTHTDYKGAGLAVPAYPPIQWQAGESDVARLNVLRILVETQEPVTIRYVRMTGRTRSVAVTTRLQRRVIAAVARGGRHRRKGRRNENELPGGDL